MILKYYINKDKLDITTLCANKNGIDILEDEILKNGYNNICWSNLLCNNNAIFLVNRFGIINLMYDLLYRETILSSENYINEIQKLPDTYYIWRFLYENPKAINMVIDRINEKGIDNNFRYLCSNTSDIAICLLKNEILRNDKSQYINWYDLCSNLNINAIKLIDDEYEKNFNSENIFWYSVCSNNSAGNLIKKEYIRDRNSSNLHWNKICSNTHSSVIEIIQYEITLESDKILWDMLCLNTETSFLIKDEYIKNRYSDKIYWYFLCKNSSKCAIDILTMEYNLDCNSCNLDWPNICNNIGAIDILNIEYDKNPDSKKLEWNNICYNLNSLSLIKKELVRNPNSKNINYSLLSRNPNIFDEYEYILK